ncbi:hypothetical protein L210DRAFT_3557703 [Boletus edulis BED1]|uniref:F-box domain-containing protein n=1 Tax=Boletus edulis BED1 TaxID=1328754 RepID=A0AAD4BJZ7_BOLED|nr:hypothetical protein L210DRAFT_3557703 [Boletus edulis BED1]
MGVSQTPEQAEQAYTFLPNNPFVPPKGGICLINNLPLELLSYIFAFGSTDDGIENEEDTHDHHDHQTTDIFAESESSNVSLPFTFVVSHVCRRWRNIALLTPSFWTTIVVTLKARPPYERVSTLLKRSKSLPIDIFVTSQFHRLVVSPSPADFQFLLAILIPHIHRWRTMEISAPTEQLMRKILSVVSDPSVPAASQLTTLELHNIQKTRLYTGLPVSRHLTLFGGSAPLLTRIVLWGVHVDWDQPWIASASNLTDLVLACHLEAARPSLAQFFAILRNAPALEKLYLRQSGPARDRLVWPMVPPSPPVDFDAPIQLARLTDFHLELGPQTCTTWFRKFTFPTLKNLVLWLDYNNYTELVEEFTRPAPSLSASQASCSLLNGLESLKIVRLRCRKECIKTLYGELQNLRSLNLSLSYLVPLFLDILSTPCTLPGRGNIWLPRLVRLYLSGTPKQHGRPLRELVSKRRELGAPLSSLFVTTACAVDDRDVEWFKENVKRFEVFKGSDADDSGWNEDVDED